MSDNALQAQVEAARAYEGLHVPAIFSEWPEHVLDAANVSPGDDVLDVACGTGVLTRAVEKRVGPNGSAHGLDLNPGMLAVAAKLNPSIDWREGAAESLPFPDASFDAVVSQFGLMFFADRKAAITEMLRVLEPGGRLAVAVWDALENSPAYSLEVAMLERMAGPEAANALSAPFVLGDVDGLVSIFRDAGVRDPSAQTHVGTARFPSIRTMVEADLRGWLPVMGVTLGESVIQDILAEAESVLASFVEPDGTVVFDSPAHIVRGHGPV